MYKLISVCAGVLAALCLTSCLRDAERVPYNTVTTKEPMYEMTESSPSVTLSESTAPMVDPAPEPTHKEVLKWTSRHPCADTVIMTPEEITAENRRMSESSDAITDLISYADTISAEELCTLILKHSVPSDKRYDKDGKEITDDHIGTVKLRMTVDKEGELPVKRGIMTSRGNLRAIPDDKPYYKSPDNPYDSIQHTELAVGTPVLVMFTTFDAEYHFVVSYAYSGWMKSCDVALTENRELWTSFAARESFVCITDALYRHGEVKLDMGVTLPLVSYNENDLIVTLPVRQSDGTLGQTEITIPRLSASIGYLPYTYENYLNQAFKYEGTHYGWGGLDDGIDCSGFVSNVFKCFGFNFPRDTKDQDKVVGTALSVSGQAHETIASGIDSGVPTVVYYPGHTLLYIGYEESNGKYYFIHAPQIGESVSVTTKTDLSGMTYIGAVGEIPTV